jgi:all-trans-8'-apo-beta-carotenal 15,15'-oxygenase
VRLDVSSPVTSYRGQSNPADAQSAKVTDARNPRSGWYDFDMWSKAFVSQLNEYEYAIGAEEIVGTIPDSLHGTLFRAMPARFERGETRYGHYLDGDGYITRLSIDKNGRAHFSSKYVQTEEFKAESRADKVLYRSTFRTQRPSNFLLGKKDGLCLNNAFDLNLKNLANTNVVYWGKKLVALFEAGVPYELDPTNLATKGAYNLEVPNLRSGLPVFIPELPEWIRNSPLFGMSSTAHPKIDPVKDRLVSWVWAASVGDGGPLDTQPMLDIYEWTPDWQLVNSQPIRHVLTDTTVSPHDFSVTDRYYVFCENRLSGNTVPYILGTKSPAECVNISPSAPMIINLVPRNQAGHDQQSKNAEQVIKVPRTPGFTIHSVCAFESQRDQTLHLFTSAWQCETVMSGQIKGGLLGAWEGTAPNFDDIPVTLLYHTVIDLASGSLISHAPFRGMEQTIIEHPHINPRY